MNKVRISLGALKKSIESIAQPGGIKALSTEIERIEKEAKARKM